MVFLAMSRFLPLVCHGVSHKGGRGFLQSEMVSARGNNGVDRGSRLGEEHRSGDTKGEIMAIDVEKVRAETPGAAHRIHLNNAGAGLMPLPVLDAMTGYLSREA